MLPQSRADAAETVLRARGSAAILEKACYQYGNHALRETVNWGAEKNRTSPQCCPTYKLLLQHHLIRHPRERGDPEIFLKSFWIPDQVENDGLGHHPVNDYLFTVLTYTTTPDKRISASPAEKSHQLKFVGTKESTAF